MELKITIETSAVLQTLTMAKHKRADFLEALHFIYKEMGDLGALDAWQFLKQVS